MRTQEKGFTLAELLIVVSIILVLVSIGAYLIADSWRLADRVHCANNMRQVGLCILAMAADPTERSGKGLGEYPPGGDGPGTWNPATYAAVRERLDGADVFTCPAADAESPTYPEWATCSFAYFANLNPTYTCTCPACTSGTQSGEKIWSIYWAGVDYTGGHKDGTRNTDCSELKEFPLARNLVFSGTGQPVVPEMLDTHVWRTQRRLREVPETVEDNGRRTPLLMDVAVLTRLPEGDHPAPYAHRNITPQNQTGVLYSNHCATPAFEKNGWGVNVFYTTGNVEWVPWRNLVVQCKVVTESGNRYYLGPARSAHTTPDNDDDGDDGDDGGDGGGDSTPPTGPKGLVIEADFWLTGAGSHYTDAHIGLASKEPSGWGMPYIVCLHAHKGGSNTRDYEMYLSAPNGEVDYKWIADVYPSDTWFHAKIVIRPDRKVEFWMNDVRVWTSTKTIDVDLAGPRGSVATAPPLEDRATSTT